MLVMQSEWNYAIALGIISCVIVSFACLAHLSIFFQKIISPGGIMELVIAGFMVAWWTVGVMAKTMLSFALLACKASSV